MHVLIVKTSSLGDIVHCFPVLDYLREFWEPLTIDWVVESRCRTLVERHPGVDHVIPFDSKRFLRNCYTMQAWKDFFHFRRCLRRNAYDVVFDLQGNSKSGMITSMVRSRHKVGFGTNTVPEWPNLWSTHHQYDPPQVGNIREDYLYLVQTFMQEDSFPSGHPTLLRLSQNEEVKIEHKLRKPVFLVCPWSKWENKTLSKKTLVRFLHQLHTEFGANFLIVWGDEEEKEQAQHLQQMFPRVSELLEKMPFPQLQQAFLKVDAVVCMDSLPLHLAGAADVPTFSIFGPSLASRYAPEGEKHYSIQGPCPYGKKFSKRCPQLRTCTTGLCMKGLDPQVLFEHFREWYGTINQSTHHQRHALPDRTRPLAQG